MIGIYKFMEDIYKQIIDCVLLSGRRIKEKAGHIKDIGVTKEFLTEEDLRIERELTVLIKNNCPEHAIFAEEENDVYKYADDIWLMDPISGTGAFIRGENSYSIVISHVHKKEILFSVIYVPALDELYTAKKGEGTFLNNKQIFVSNRENNFSVIDFICREWENNPLVAKFKNELKQFKVEEIVSGEAANYCKVATGKADGVVCFVKDIFSATAGSLIIREAGGYFTNLLGNIELQSNDSTFIAGNPSAYKTLFNLAKTNGL